MLKYENTYFFRGNTNAPESNQDHYEATEIQVGKDEAGNAIKAAGFKRKAVTACVSIDVGVVPDSIEALCVLDSVHSYVKSQFVDKFLAVPEVLDLVAFRTWLEGDGSSGAGAGGVRIAKEVIQAVLAALQVYIEDTTGKAALAASTAYTVRQGFGKIALMSEKGFNCPPTKLNNLWDQLASLLAGFNEAASDDNVTQVVTMWQDKIKSHKEALAAIEQSSDFGFAV
jgi:hypothetical protein